MLPSILAVLGLSLGAVQGADEAPARALETRVDTRVELLTALARLAEFDEFRMATSRSPYAERVDAHFAPFREHAAVAKLRALRSMRGVSFDAIPSLALHLGPLPKLEERIPFDRDPERLDARWGGKAARPFLRELRDFAQDSKALEFFESERELYARAEARLAETLSRSRALPWFDAFFGAKQGARYVAVPGLLCGSGNYGAGVRFADGTPEEVTPILGCSKFDADGVPEFDDSYLPVCVHELAHTYANPFIDRFEKRLRAAGERLFASAAKRMQRQGYGNGKTLLYESLVRAAVVRCRRATEGDQAGAEQEREEARRGFLWVPEIATLLGEYERERERFPTFEAFMPRVVELFERVAKDAEPEGSGAPVLVSSEPAAGARKVDPELERMTFRFDRPMRDKSWAIVGRAEDKPEVTGDIAYDEALVVLTVPVRLEPGRTYRFWLNSERFMAFASADGVPLEPIEITFTTRR